MDIQDLNIGDTLTDKFTYSITDGNGDSATTTLTLVINGEDDIVDIVGENASVMEGGITITDLSENLNLLDNDFLTNAPGTISSFNYIDENGSSQAGVVGQTVDTQYGSITVNANGTWSFTSDATEYHGTIVDVISYTVTDTIGYTNSASFSIEITDDIPTAYPDSNSVQEEDILSASGNVFVNDVIGADITNSPVTGVKAGDNTSSDAVGNIGSSVSGLYGSVVLNSDGSYTYNLDNENPTVQDLDTNQFLNDVFTYTITDSDGDTSTTTLSITVNGKDEPPPNYLPTAVADSVTLESFYFSSTPTLSGDVFNASLSGENEDDIGGDGADTNGPVTGVEAGSGAGPVSGGIGTTITGSHGDLVIDQYGQYTYTFTDPAGFANGNFFGLEGGLSDDVFTYTITDSNGDSSTTTLTIKIPSSTHIEEDSPRSIFSFNNDIDNEIDLREENDGFDNLTLSDVIDLTDSSNDLTILGDASESLTFKSELNAQWSKSDTTITENNIIFDIYTNTGDSSVEVAVQQDINDQII